MQIFSEPENLNKNLEASPVIVSNYSICMFTSFLHILFYFKGYSKSNRFI